MSEAKLVLNEDAIRSVYSNVAQVTSSPFDVSILFARVRFPGLLVGKKTLEEIPVEDVVQVFMSHQQAEVLLQLLGKQVEERRASRPVGEVTVTRTENEEPEDEEK